MMAGWLDGLVVGEARCFPLWRSPESGFSRESHCRIPLCSVTFSPLRVALVAFGSLSLVYDGENNRVRCNLDLHDLVWLSSSLGR